MEIDEVLKTPLRLGKSSTERSVVLDAESQYFGMGADHERSALIVTAVNAYERQREVIFELSNVLIAVAQCAGCPNCTAQARTALAKAKELS